MARPLSMLYKGLPRSTQLYNSMMASASILQQSLEYSTKLGGDSDTHEDFQPTSKVEGSAISMKGIVSQDVKENPVVIYMKGVPDAPRCGFSALAVKVLQLYKVPITPRNILENPQIKEGIKAFRLFANCSCTNFSVCTSNWPTFPQVFVKGEFIGGSDIVLNMHQNGELRELLSDISGDNDKA